MYKIPKILTKSLNLKINRATNIILLYSILSLYHYYLTKKMRMNGITNARITQFVADNQQLENET